MSFSFNPQETILGLDLGAQSLGWVLIHAPHNKPQAIVASGIRVFQAGVNIEEKGEKASKNLDRRAARGRRRLLDRRRRRLNKLLHILQRNGLLPEGELNGVMKREDSPLANLFLDDVHYDPYQLRAKAIGEASLEPFEIGRVIYHLAQRRGFKSNAKLGDDDPFDKQEEDKKKKSKKKETSDNDQDDAGVVKRETAALEKEWRDEKQFKTWGQFLASLDPHERRRRTNRTLRRWYDEEFNAIWDAQAKYHPDLLTGDLKEAIYDCIFYQRPLKSVHKYIGPCALESRPLWIDKDIRGEKVKFRKICGPKRAPMYCLPAQRVRLLQTLNDLRIVDNKTAVSRSLTEEEHEAILERLERSREVNFTTLRNALGLKGTVFNFEEGKRKTLKGNRTGADMRKIFGERWDNFSDSEREQAVTDVCTIQDKEALARRAVNHWKLEGDAASQFVKFAPEQGYHNFSRRALRKLLSHLEAGKDLHEAIEKEYPDRYESTAVDVLPPVEDLRNPIVQRAVTELRKVVNAIVREYGKPGRIRLELARELKKSQRKRDEIVDQNRARERERKKAAEEIQKLTGTEHITNYQIQKWLLFQECGGECPYTGQTIQKSTLFSDESPVEIEHIIPFSRSMDNSFANKTLCYNWYNEQVKGNKTPWETVGERAEEGDSDAQAEWRDMLKRVKKFKADPRLKNAKLKRFTMKNTPEDQAEVIEEFSERALRSTQYASRFSRQYLAQLYGGDLRKVQVATGQVTAFLRRAWRVSRVLNGDGEKTRDDHRHHAVDAFCLACATPRMIKELHTAAARGENINRAGTFPDMPDPWDGYFKELKDSIDNIIVSHRANRKISGALHEATHYARRKNPFPEGNEKRELITLIRKPLKSLKPNHINQIPDAKGLRKVVQKKVDELKVKGLIKDGKEMTAFSDENNLPFFKTHDGREIPIRKVRIQVNDKPAEIAGGDHKRHVNLGNNHHLAVYMAKDRTGNDTWRTEVISTLKAAERKKNSQPLVAKEDENGNQLVFSLVEGDSVKMGKGDKEDIWVFRKMSHSQFIFTRHTDARDSGNREDYMPRPGSGPTLKKTGCQKVQISPTGKISPSND
ncbi:MAG: type II CRISPR RNA-guided endonuclease Cas9 [Candidatus Sumerlaeota bacterium]